MAERVKNRRLNTQTDVKRFLVETINELRQLEPKLPKDAIEKARVLGYLASLVQANIRENELEKRIEETEKLIEQIQRNNAR